MNSNNTKLKKKAAFISLFVGFGMFTAKITAYLITGSSAIFSDAAESVVHVLATSMALYSIILSSKPADESHLYGHGNVEYFSAGIEGFLILIAALTIIYSSIANIISGFQPKQLNTGTLIIAAAGIVNLFLGFYLIRKGKITNSLTLIADGKHVLTDSYTSIGVVVGLILVLITNFYLLDPLIAIAVALNILITGYKLIRESIGGLMAETDPELLKEIVSELAGMRKDYWIDIHQLKFRKSGDRIFIDFHLILPYYFTIQESHAEEKLIEEKLIDRFNKIEIRIHMDYCKPEVCRYCIYSTCKVRKENHSVDFNWDVEKFIGPPVYEVK